MVLRRWWSALRSRPSHVARKRQPCLRLEKLEDRLAPAAKLVSYDVRFSPPDSASGQSEATPTQSISDDGKYLVFTSVGTHLVASQTGSANQNVYIYNTITGTNTLISHAAGTGNGARNGNNNSFNPVISGDGSTVAFFSLATDLSSSFVPTSGTVQLYLYDVQAQTLKPVSHQPNQPNAPTDASNPFIPDIPSNSYGAINTLGYYAGVPQFNIVGGGLGLPSLSDDGQFLAYVSNASNLGATINDSTGFGTLYTEAFLYDRANDTNTLISHVVGNDTLGADGYVSTVSISGDGQTIAFTSPAIDITGAFTDGFNDQLYVYSLTDNATTGLSSGEIVLASHAAADPNAGTTVPDEPSYLFGFTEDGVPSLTNDGKFIAYYHAGGDLVSGQGGTGSVLNVFRYDVLDNSNKLATHTGDGVTAGDNPENRIAPLGVGPSEAKGPQISDDGRFIAFANNSRNLGGLDFGSSYDGRDQVYLYDADAANSSALTLVSHADGSLSTPNAKGASAPSMTSNGRYVTYIDWAYPAIDPVDSIEANIRFFDRQSSSTSLPPSLGTVYDPTMDNAPTINAAVLAPTIMNANGGVIAWNGTGTNVVPLDTNGRIDVFINTDNRDNSNGPTEIFLSDENGDPVMIVVESIDTLVGTLTTDVTGTFDYSFGIGTGDDDNDFFAIVGDQLKTDVDFPIGRTDTTFSILLHAEDPNDSSRFVDQRFDLTIVRVPTDLEVVLERVSPTPDREFSEITTTADGSNRTFTVTLVTGTGDDDNDLFRITNGDTLTTDSDFPTTETQTEFTVRLRTTDDDNPTLFYEEAFTIALVTQPTDLSITEDRVVSDTDQVVGTLTTTSDDDTRTFVYTLVTGTNDNDFFVLDGDKLKTDSDFPVDVFDTYTVRVRTADPDYPDVFFEQEFTITSATDPTDAALDDTTVDANPGDVVGTLTSTADDSQQTFVYSLVTGNGDTGNQYFVINGDQLVVDTDVPETGDTYTVRIRSTDSQFSTLFYEEVFTITTNTVLRAPTDMDLSNDEVTASPGLTVGTLTTTANSTGRTFDYTLVTGTGDDDNGFFVIDGDQVKTDSDVPLGSDTYTVRVRTTDSTRSDLFYEEAFTIAATAVPPPTDMALDNDTVDAAPDLTVGTLTTTASGSGRTFTYTLVSGTGSDDNGFFVIDGDQVKTDTDVPETGDTYSIRVRTTDAARADLFYEEAFTIATNTVVDPPTDMALSNSAVTASPDLTVGTLTTTSDDTSRTYNYSLVSGTGDDDNGFFVIDGDQVVTDTDVPLESDTYTVRVRTTDSVRTDLFYDEVFTIAATAVPPPTDMDLSNDTADADPAEVVGTLTTTADGAGRDFTYTLVSGTGSDDNGFFVIDGDQVLTDSDVPSTTDTYTIRVRTTDDARPDLFYEEAFAINLTVVADPLPEVDAPSSVSSNEGDTVQTGINASVDAADQDEIELSHVVIDNVPDDATLSAGTDNGDGSWTVQANQLSGLTITVDDNVTVTLTVTAVADVIGENRTVASDPVEVTLIVENVDPVVSLSGSGTFDPTVSSVVLNLDATDPGDDSVQTVTVDWGDGTVQTFNGVPDTVTHQYAILDATYQAVVTVTDEDGTYEVPAVTYNAELASQTMSVVAELYVDVLGRTADLGGLQNFTQLVNSGVSLDTIIRGMVNSVEYRSDVVNDLYVEYLNRNVDPTGLADGLAFLAAGGDPRDLAARILASDEFFNLAGGTNAGFLSLLYQEVLGREIDTSGLLSNLDLLVPNDGFQIRTLGETREAVVQGLLDSDESRAARAEEFYAEYLDRQGDPGGIAAHADTLSRQSEIDVALIFLTSQEYQSQFAAK